MKMNLDTIQFESRYEIRNILQALEKYQEEHPTSDIINDVKRLIDLLDVMDMNW